MSCRKNFLTNLHPSSPYRIELPNGTKTVALHKGNAYLGPNFTVKNILFIPELKYNLISLTQLSRETNCFITLFNDVHMIQDLILRTPIRVGE